MSDKNYVEENDMIKIKIDNLKNFKTEPVSVYDEKAVNGEGIEEFFEKGFV
jgi:hypothetical protein